MNAWRLLALVLVMGATRAAAAEPRPLRLFSRLGVARETGSAGAAYLMLAAGGDAELRAKAPFALRLSYGLALGDRGSQAVSLFRMTQTLALLGEGRLALPPRVELAAGLGPAGTLLFTAVAAGPSHESTARVQGGLAGSLHVDVRLAGLVVARLGGLVVVGPRGAVDRIEITLSLGR